jgi:hypothetical protein
MLLSSRIETVTEFAIAGWQLFLGSSGKALKK